MRRGRKATFAVPYHGEDVHFHWRGRDSHYVKTAEELNKDIVFFQYLDQLQSAAADKDIKVPGLDER